MARSRRLRNNWWCHYSLWAPIRNRIPICDQNTSDWFGRLVIFDLTESLILSGRDILCTTAMEYNSFVSKGKKQYLSALSSKSIRYYLLICVAVEKFKDFCFRNFFNLIASLGFETSLLRTHTTIGQNGLNASIKLGILRNSQQLDSVCPQFFNRGLVSADVSHILCVTECFIRRSLDWLDDSERTRNDMTGLLL